MDQTWPDRKRIRYTALPVYQNSGVIDHEVQDSASGWRKVVLALLLIFLSGGAGYFAGQHERRSEYNSGLLAPAGTVQRKFVYNRTFSIAPNADTTKAWHDIFPANGGFIHHPALAKNFSGLAVFHQLHCLHALYNIYYQVNHQHQRTKNNDPTNSQQHGHNGSEEDPSIHARHCFDYLRQSLMCHADTNLEPYNYHLDGVTGWGTKVCRDYKAVVAFAEDWGGSKYSTQA